MIYEGVELLRKMTFCSLAALLEYCLSNQCVEILGLCLENHASPTISNLIHSNSRSEIASTLGEDQKLSKDSVNFC